jgi:hypothetical protein
VSVPVPRAPPPLITPLSDKFGVPLDTRHTYTKTDWEVWTAGIVTDQGLRDTFISSLKAYLSNGLNNQAFPDLYDTITGVALGFRARPVVGGHLALVSDVVRCQNSVLMFCLLAQLLL